MTDIQVSRDTFLDILRGSSTQQQIERYSYYNRKVSNGDINFKEEEMLETFFDFIDDHYEYPITDVNELKKIATDNDLLYIDDDGLEAISLLKEYNPVRYVELGRQKKLIDWAWELSDLRKQRYSELKQQTGYDSVAETYLNELVLLIKSDYYFQESVSETYFLNPSPLVFDSPHKALLYEFMVGKLFTTEELDILTKNYKEGRLDQQNMSAETRNFLDHSKIHRKWVLKNKENILLFDEPVLNFIEGLNSMEEVI